MRQSLSLSLIYQGALESTLFLNLHCLEATEQLDLCALTLVSGWLQATEKIGELKSQAFAVPVPTSNDPVKIPCLSLYQPRWGWHTEQEEGSQGSQVGVNSVHTL